MSDDRAAARHRGRSVTLGDVASASGVSVSTVSRVFSRPDLLSPETVERVRSIAGELGYHGNHAARALVTGRFRNLAMIVPDIGNPFYPPLVRAIQNRADGRGYAVFLGDTDERGDRELTLLSRLAGQVDGFVLAGTRLDEATLLDFSQTRPTVLVNRDVAALSRVLIDSGQGVRDAVRHLHRLGHRHIVYVAGPAESWSNQQRRAAAEAAVADLGMRLDVIDPGLHTFDGGRAAADPVLDTEATAAVAFDDVIAHGLLTGLRARGLGVPGDFSIIGCDDTLATGTDPALTTIAHDPEEAGTAAVDLLLAAVAGELTAPERIAIPTRLVHRQTTAAPRRD
jgi:LacI family transcriptional regulator